MFMETQRKRRSTAAVYAFPFLSFCLADYEHTERGCLSVFSRERELRESGENIRLVEAERTRGAAASRRGDATPPPPTRYVSFRFRLRRQALHDISKRKSVCNIPCK